MCKGIGPISEVIEIIDLWYVGGMRGRLTLGTGILCARCEVVLSNTIRNEGYIVALNKKDRTITVRGRKECSSL